MKPKNLIVFVNFCLVHGFTFIQFWKDPGCTGASSVYYVLQSEHAASYENVPAELPYYKEGVSDWVPSLPGLTGAQDCKNYVGDVSLVNNHTSAVLYVSGVSSPMAPAGTIYCRLDRPKSNAQGLFKYFQIWIAEGSCAEGIACVKEGLLKIDPSRSCTSEDYQYQYQLNSVNFTQLTQPYSMNAVRVITRSAKSDVKWNSFVPIIKFKPQFNTVLEIFALLLWIIAILLFSAAFVYFAYEWHKRKNHFITCGEMLVWLIACVVYICSAATASVVDRGPANLSDLARAFASYYSLIYTTRTFFELAFPASFVESNEGCMPRTKAKVAVYCFIFALQAVMELVFINAETVEFYNTYYIVYTAWIMIQFAILLVPPMFLIYRVVTDKRSYGNLWERMERDVLLKAKFMMPLSGMLGCMIIWIVFRTIPPLSLGSQRVQNGYIIIREFFFAMAFLGNSFILDPLRKTVEILDDRQRAPKKAPSRTFDAPGATFHSFIVNRVGVPLKKASLKAPEPTFGTTKKVVQNNIVVLGNLNEAVYASDTVPAHDS
jgi:hypothetical protein